MKGSREEGVDEEKIEKDAKVRGNKNLARSGFYFYFFVDVRCHFYSQKILFSSIILVAMSLRTNPNPVAVCPLILLGLYCKGWHSTPIFSYVQCYCFQKILVSALSTLLRYGLKVKIWFRLSNETQLDKKFMAKMANVASLRRERTTRTSTTPTSTPIFSTSLHKGRLVRTVI